MPRNFSEHPDEKLGRWPGFNEAAADAAEFCCVLVTQRSAVLKLQ